MARAFLSLSLLLVCFSANFAWGEIIIQKGQTETKSGELNDNVSNYGTLIFDGASVISGKVFNGYGAILTLKNDITLKNNADLFNSNGALIVENLAANPITITAAEITNADNATFTIKSPTIINGILHNRDNATLTINNHTTINGDYVYNYRGATTIINGAKLTMGDIGAFYNDAIIIFSALNGIMGQVIITNNNLAFNNYDEGKVQVDVTGLMAGQRYQIIKGAEILLDAKDVSFLYGTGKYLGNGWVLINEVLFDDNQASLKNAIESKTAGNPSWISKATFDTDKTLQTSVVSQPKNLINTFKTQIPTDTPLNSAYVSRLTASSKAIMNDSSNFVSPLERASETQFFATPFGGVLKGDDVNGNLFGLSLGLTHIDDKYIAQGHFAYAKGKSTQDLMTQSTELNANLFQVGGFARLFFYDELETDFNANFIFAKFELNNVWLDNALPNSNATFNNYQANVGATLGYRFGDSFSIKPFVGVQGYYEKQGKFKQESGLELTSEAYSAMIMDALAGLETRYILDNGSFIYAKASVENKLYNSHKEVFMRVAHNDTLTYENESYDNVINANLGARLLSTKSLNLDIEALYKHYDNGLDYFGGNLGVKFRF